MSNEYAMSTKKLVVIVSTAVVGSVVVTIFAMLRVANSDHFTIIANAKDIIENKQDIKNIEQNYVSRPELQQTVLNLKEGQDGIKDDVSKLVERLDRLLEQ